MLLTADIGNTNTAIGLYEGDKLAAHWRLTTVPTRTVDELEIWLRNLLELENLTGADVSGVAREVEVAESQLTQQKVELARMAAKRDQLQTARDRVRSSTGVAAISEAV